MKKTYKQAIFKCMDYDEIMRVFDEKYASKFQLIGYQLTRIDNLSYKATLTLYPIRKGVKSNGRKNV